MGQQNSCKTLIGVHSTMHLITTIKSCNYYVHESANVCASVCLHIMCASITSPLLHCLATTDMNPHAE